MINRKYVQNKIDTSFMRDAMCNAVSGVCSAGFRIEVHPVARMGPIFQHTIIAGKFHGIICPTTPTGSFLVKENTLPSV